jgi:hypothetical protein
LRGGASRLLQRGTTRTLGGIIEPKRLSATPWDESVGTCDCCGRTSKTIWGDLSDDNGDTVAVYYIQFTIAAPEHYPNVDLLIGNWDEGASPKDRVLVSLLYRPGPEGGSFLVVDPAGRRANSRELCGRALRRAEVIGSPLAQEVFSLVDALWLTEPRIAEVKELNNAA